MSAVSTSGRKSLICRVTSNHKWVRLETASEEAYECKRCGKRYFGKLEDPDLTPFTGGHGIGGN
jgi:hypothetical protein